MHSDNQPERLGDGLGDSNGLSWTSNYCQIVAKQHLNIEHDEKILLRELAKDVAEIASWQLQQEKRRLWTEHNDLELTRPLIFCDPENA